MNVEVHWTLKQYLLVITIIIIIYKSTWLVDQRNLKVLQFTYEFVENWLDY